jgi:hypothetical protein
MSFTDNSDISTPRFLKAASNIMAFSLTPSLETVAGLLFLSDEKYSTGTLK